MPIFKRGREVAVRIIKIFNTNAVLVDDKGVEKIATGKGVGFGRKKKDIVPNHLVEKIFVTDEDKSDLIALLKQIPEACFNASEEIIRYAEEKLGIILNNHIHILLADHISFTIERLQDGIFMHNKFLKEVEVLYPEEFLVAQWALVYLSNRFDLQFPLDEAVYITMHLHSARANHPGTKKNLKEVTIISETVDLISKELKIDFDDLSMRLNYTRLLTHLRLMLERMETGTTEPLADEINYLIINKYQKSYQLALQIVAMIQEKFKLTVPKTEYSYLTLHLERLLKSE